MTWDKPQILTKLRQLHKTGKDLSYNALCRTHQAIVSAAAYHFGSYRRAVEKAGISYKEIVRRPRWTKPGIVQLIKLARRRGEDLHWAAVTRRRDDLGKAAFASLQPRLFGSWDRALHAAGLDSDDIARYRKWDKNSIAFELRGRAKDGDDMSSGSLQAEDPGLHAAAIRHFGTYDKALRGAGLNPLQVRKRRVWSQTEVLRAMRGVHRNGGNCSGSAVRRNEPALYGAAIRLFGSFTAARSAAGIAWKSKKRKRPRISIA